MRFITQEQLVILQVNQIKVGTPKNPGLERKMLNNSADAFEWCGLLPLCPRHLSESRFLAMTKQWIQKRKG